MNNSKSKCHNFFSPKQDLEIYDLEDFMYNDVNITTYRLVDYSNPVVRNMLKEIDKYHPNVGKQMLHRGQLIKVS